MKSFKNYSLKSKITIIQYLLKFKTNTKKFNNNITI